MKIRISGLDKLFSKYIRTRDNWTCQRCGTKYEPPTNGLHNMHCFTRGWKSTRFDPDNCMAGCYGCHSYLDSHPLEKYAFWEKKIGKEQFEKLDFKARNPTKIDLFMIKLWTTSMLKGMEDKEKSQIGISVIPEGKHIE